jgi:D-alanyl-lipoteichoic acid acyltransferase DltB (MBOAT superfamily)
MEAFLQSPFWGWLTLAAVVIGFIAASAFVVRYQWVAGFTWWRNPDGTRNLFGRFLMIRKILLSVLFIVVLLNRLAPGWHAQKAVTAVLMAAFALHTFVPYRLLTEAQRASRKEEVEKHGRAGRG